MAAAATKPNAVAEAQERRFRANDVFDKRNKILFQDDFRSGGFGKWNLSKDYRYGIQKENPQEDEGRGSPWPGGRKKAVRFCVDRGPNAFRSEISLPSEKRFNERWYGARIYVPKEWVFDPSRGNDIVIQWHGIPGN